MNLPQTQRNRLMNVGVTYSSLSAILFPHYTCDVVKDEAQLGNLIGNNTQNFAKKIGRNSNCLRKKTLNMHFNYSVNNYKSNKSHDLDQL